MYIYTWGKAGTLALTAERFWIDGRFLQDRGLVMDEDCPMTNPTNNRLTSTAKLEPTVDQSAAPDG